MTVCRRCDRVHISCTCSSADLRAIRMPAKLVVLNSTGSLPGADVYMYACTHIYTLYIHIFIGRYININSSIVLTNLLCIVVLRMNFLVAVRAFQWALRVPRWPPIPTAEANDFRGPFGRTWVGSEALLSGRFGGSGCRSSKQYIILGT